MLPARSKLLVITLVLIVTFSSFWFFFHRPASASALWSSASSRTTRVGQKVTSLQQAKTPTHDTNENEDDDDDDDDDSPPKPGEVLMVTASSGTNGFLGIPNLKEMVYENRMSYAHRWGYDFMWANISSYDFGPKVYWNKIPILQDALVRFPKAKWMWWLDMDIIIMNSSLDLHTHLLSQEGMMRNLVFDTRINKVGGGDSGMRAPKTMKRKDVNFLIASGGWGMNVGSFLMRRSVWTDWVLEMWADPLPIAQNWVLPENDGWTHLYKHHKIVRDHTGLTNQRALNGYPAYNKLGAHWQKGDILIHFAGCGNSTRCPAHWNEYWAKREKYEVPAFIQKELKDGTAKIEAYQKGVPMP